MRKMKFKLLLTSALLLTGCVDGCYEHCRKDRGECECQFICDGYRDCEKAVDAYDDIDCETANDPLPYHCDD